MIRKLSQQSARRLRLHSNINPGLLLTTVAGLFIYFFDRHRFTVQRGVYVF